MTNVGSEFFVMHGAREAMQAGLAHVEEQVDGIEQAVRDNAGLTFDLARTLIESACRTILDERGIGFSRRDDLPKLFKTAKTYISFLPPTADGDPEAQKSLAKTLSGLGTAVQGVCELRNACGFASHGSERSRPKLEGAQALLAAETADAIVGFLYRMHRQESVPEASARLLYEDNIEFNDYIDEGSEPVRVLDLEFRASEVLFQMEPDTYRIYLAEWAPDPADEDGTPPEADPDEVTA